MSDPKSVEQLARAERIIPGGVNSPVRAFCTVGGKPVFVSCGEGAYLVGADGTLSKVRNRISPDFDRGLGLIPNYEEWYTGEINLEPHWLHQ